MATTQIGLPNRAHRAVPEKRGLTPLHEALAIGLGCDAPWWAIRRRRHDEWW